MTTTPSVPEEVPPVMLRSLVGFLALMAPALPLAAQVPPAQAGSAVVLLVRHAETSADGTTDPELSESGRARAEALAAALASVPLTAVHSSPYRRTRGTAAPIAAARALPVEAYDPGQLAELAERLVRSGGTHLVVGHSNTTPALVRALGGDPGTPISETDHARLYVVVLGGREARTLLLHLP